MKNKTYILIVIAMVLNVSCGEDFLYKEPQGSIYKDALMNPTGIDLLTVNAYANLTENGWGATPFNWTYGGIYGGDANKGSSPNDQAVINTMETYSVLPSNSYINTKWTWIYKGVNRVNTALRMLNEEKTLTEDIRKSRKGELLFLRTLYYFEGVKVFGGFIPWIDETIIENNPLIHNDKDINTNIIADIDSAIANLPEIQDFAGRANIWAAKTLKAKILMQQGDIVKAKPILKDIIENGQTSNGKKYRLEDDLNANFDSFRDNGTESIFAVQFSNDTNNNGNSGMSLCYPHGGSGSPGGCCGFYQPSNELANSFKVNNQGLPFLDQSYREGEMVTIKNTSQETYAPISINTNVAVDPRLDFAIGRYGIPYKDWGVPKNNWIRDVNNGGFFLPKKHVYTKKEEESGLAGGSISGGWAPGSSINLQYLSFRDVILLYAECLANDNQLPEAMEMVNKIRTRAGLDINIIKVNGVPAANYKIANYPTSHEAYSNKEICIKAIRMERKLELAMEGQRWFDLARWGGKYMSNELSKYIAFEKKFISKFATASTLDTNKTMFPIPDRQIKTMGNDETGKPYLQQPTAWK